MRRRALGWGWMLALACMAGATMGCTSEEGPSDAGSDAAVDAGVDGSVLDAAADGSAPDAARDAGACPATEPISGTCGGSMHCEYGTETCCGQTFPSLVCNCASDTWQCYNTDACLLPADAGCP